MIKKLLVVWSALCMILVGGAAFADYESFTRSLRSVNVDVASIESAPVVSRFDVARLLNFVDCHDCRRPSSDLVDRLTSAWRTTFRSDLSVNFDDVSYIPPATQENNNYYCVAYVAEQWYMSGYPRQTSPLCWGKFCGTNNTTVADFIQVIINILSERIASHYVADWQQIEQWMQSSANSTLIRRYFSLKEQGVVVGNAAQYTQPQPLQSADEFNVYLKYCTFNLQACGMREFDTAQEQFWPVAELNILVLEDIISADEADSINVGDYVDGTTVLTSLARVKEKVACVYDDDKDKDGIKDYADSCYLTYNPTQRDLDNDGIGDVCDDDIDGDTVKNPIGVVDDNGNINTKVIAEYPDPIDNCLFTINTDQSDFNNDEIGDACSESEYFGLTIVSRKIRNGTYALAAQYTWALKDFTWDFGDGTYGQGRAVSHTFPGPGTYEVVLTALGGKKTYVATTTIVVVPDLQAALGFQILPNPLTANVPATINVTPVTTRPVWRIAWESNTQQKEGANGQVVSFAYESAGTYPIVAQAYDDQQIVAYAQGSVSLNGDISAYLRASNLNPTISQPITFTTVTAGIQRRDIVSIKWDFGDGIIQTNNSSTYTHTYAEAGPKIVKQTIYLLDGSELTNIININVLPLQAWNDQGVDLIPAKLVMNTGEPVNYRFVLNGLNWPDISRIIVDMWDGQSLTFDNSITNGYEYTYIKPGIYRIRARVEDTDGQRFYPAAHVTVLGVPLCLQKPPVAGACDMDGDTIPDMCDEDIDGDGKKNMLGLILRQPPQCRYRPSDLNNSIILTMIDRISRGDTLDNCSLTVNPDQADINGNFIGDICEGLIIPDDDRDGDGITDSKDACPDTPENMNGVEDEDGCPEFIDIPDTPAGVIAGQCNVCPCPYVDAAADLVQWDKVRAVLLGEDGKTRISTSPIEIIE